MYHHITEDTATRLKALRQEKANIEKEIKRLEEGGKVESYSPVQIFEMVDLCLRNGKDLLNDFRQVEDNFRQAGAEIYKKQSELNYSKGDILGFALDTDEKLRESPQGQSFDAFWKFIAEDNDNEINSIANAIIEEISNNLFNDGTPLCKDTLEEINFPESLKTIDSHAFTNFSKLNNIIIPDSITSLEFKDYMDYYGENTLICNAFKGTSLNLATQRRLKELGYKGEF